MKKEKFEIGNINPCGWNEKGEAIRYFIELDDGDMILLNKNAHKLYQKYKGKELKFKIKRQLNYKLEDYVEISNVRPSRSSKGIDDFIDDYLFVA